MYDAILRQVQTLVVQGQYVLSAHAQEQLEQDWQWITSADIESAILNGTIVERQWDHTYQEWKYVINGVTVGGRGMDVVVKLDVDVFIITS